MGLAHESRLNHVLGTAGRGNTLQHGSTLSSLAILTIGVVILGLPANAQVRDYGFVIGDRGEQKVMALGLLNRHTCQTLAANLRLQAKDVRSEIRFSEVTEEFRSDHPQCAGRPLIQTGVFVKPATGQRGFAVFRFLEVGGPQGPKERELVVYISDPDKKNTVPPGKADVDHIFGPVKSWAEYEKEVQTKLATARPQAPSTPERPASSPEEPQLRVQTFSIPKNPLGQFETKVNIGGIETNALIDTGATHVAIPYAMGKKLGLLTQPGTLKIPILTGNGEIEATLAQMPAISIGPYTEHGVLAAILPEGRDVPVLIGMSLLSRFKSVNMSGTTLTIMR